MCLTKSRRSIRCALTQRPRGGARLRSLLSLPSGQEPNRKALHDAAEIGDTERALDLIEQGVHIDCKDRNGYTPLMEAASEGNTETVRALLDAGADKSLGNHRGSTALQLASKDEVREMLHLSRPVEIRVED